MIDTRKAIEMAIKQMNVYAFKHLCDYQIEDKELLEAIQACKEALKLSEKQHTISDKEQPAQGIELEWYQKGWDDAKREVTQEPVAWMAMDLHTSWLTFQKEAVKDAKEIIPLYTHPAPQPAQEPVAWLRLWVDGDLEVVPNTLKGAFPVYRHSTPSWQGLSSKEIDDIVSYPWGETKDWVRAIEAKLKDKNT